MKPEIQDVLEDFSQLLSAEVAPGLSGFQAGNVAMIAAMLKMLSELWDGSAARLIEENAAIRSILVDAQEAFAGNPELSKEIPEGRDFHLSALELNNQELRRRLIQLHQQVELDDDPVAQAIDARIWNELRASVARREISSANF